MYPALHIVAIIVQYPNLLHYNVEIVEQTIRSMLKMLNVRCALHVLIVKIF